jgi:colicin import membrane protein
MAMDVERLRAVAGSVAVHLVLLGIVAFAMWERPRAPAAALNKPVIQARAVDEATAMEPVRRREAEAQRKKEALAAEKKRQAEEQQKKREAEKQRQLAEQKKKAEAEQQRQGELKRKQEAARAAEEKKRLAEEQRQKIEAAKQRQEEAEAKRKAVEEAKRKEAEARLKEAMAAEEARLAEEARQQRSQRLNRMQLQYISDIANKVTRNWLRPPGGTGTLCSVLINQIPGGEITGVRVTDCDGDIAFQRSVEAAVRKASPLPLPADPELFQREIEFVFRP